MGTLLSPARMQQILLNTTTGTGGGGRGRVHCKGGAQWDEHPWVEGVNRGWRGVNRGWRGVGGSCLLQPHSFMAAPLPSPPIPSLGVPMFPLCPGAAQRAAVLGHGAGPGWQPRAQ